MKTVIYAVILALLSAPALAAGGLLDHAYRPLAGKQVVNLQQRFAGQVLLIVNTASKCGFTPQYEGLEALHVKYQDAGFAVIGFPSGDFKGQEFADEQQIQQFCTLTYGVKFPMFEKVHVVGKQATPLYRALADASGQAPGWNFHKYLIGRDGKLIADFGSKTKPEDPELVAAIQTALKTPRPGR